MAGCRPVSVTACVVTGLGSTAESPSALVTPKRTMLVEATSVVQWICTDVGWILSS